MVVQDEHDRRLLTQEAGSEHGAEARKFLQQLPDHGLHVPAAFADYSHRCTEAITAVYPQARWPADHFQTVKNIWGHRKKARLSSRRKSMASGEAKNDQDCLDLAKTLWQWRWSRLKKPTH
jgi:hypothetical protein